MLNTRNLAFVALVAGTPAFAQDCVIGPENTSYATDDVFYDVASGWMVKPGELLPQRTLDKDSVALLTLLNAELKKKGSLFALIVPPKRGLFLPDTVYEDAIASFGSRFEKQQLLDDYAALLDQLQTTGAFVPEFYDPADQDSIGYLKTDHHWDPSLAFSAARGLWNALADQGIYRLMSDDNAYPPQRVVTSDRTGSLARLVEEACGIDFPKEAFTYLEVAKDQSAVVVDANSLFGDVANEGFDVVLLGTSFSSENTGLHFSDGLEMWLQAPVTNLAISGGGLSSSFEPILNDTAAFESELIIWEWSPNETPRSSDPVRVASAVMLNQCDGTSPSGAFELVGDDWSDWRDFAGHVVQVVPETSIRNTLIVEADYGNDSQQFLVEKKTRVPNEFRRDEWITMFSKIEDDGAFVQPNRFRIRLDGFDGRASGTIQTCGLNGQL